MYVMNILFVFFESKIGMPGFGENKVVWLMLLSEPFFFVLMCDTVLVTWIINTLDARVCILFHYNFTRKFREEWNLHVLKVILQWF